MKILLTGASGYIGKRLLPVLLEQEHQVICVVRDVNRFPKEGIYLHKNISLFQADFLKSFNYSNELDDIDAAYYLIHSMSSGVDDFEKLEAESAHNFLNLIGKTKAKQVIYLSGITNEQKLSKHLNSRKNVEEILKKGTVPLTIIKAGIIVGSGSASFEIIRDLVEKLPIMVTPQWLNTKHQPVAIKNVIECLIGVLLNEKTFSRSFDIGGPDIITYKQMLLQFAEIRGLKRYIFTLPIMTPRLSSYWLYFITAASYKLAVNLVNSMKIEIIAQDDELIKMLNIKLISYKEAVELAFQRISQNLVLSSWKDSLISSSSQNSIQAYINVPVNGCVFDIKEVEIAPGNVEQTLKNIWNIGGARGWYYADFLWKIRGYLDKSFGGVGLRRGRTNSNNIFTGNALDFWRVLVADKEKRRLLLYAEMKLPGEAWLQFEIISKNNKEYLRQTATYRPIGLLGRLYWYAMLPFHFFVFKGMAKNITEFKD